MSKIILLFSLLIFMITISFFSIPQPIKEEKVLSAHQKTSNWLLLHRRSNKEFLYHGIAGDKKKSILIKTFQVKVGIPYKRPTPLPKLLGKEYWLITSKQEAYDFETAPYFLELNIPVTDEEPFGPYPYEECNGQCNWILPGSFGLHGVAGDMSKLSESNLGSSGCVRHSDQDITFLYNLLNPKNEEIRYYIEDI